MLCQLISKVTILLNFVGNGTEKAILTDDYRVKCEIPCSSRYTCENCTQGPCMWCSSQQMCIESNAYAAVFPVAQCMEWTTQMTKCRGCTTIYFKPFYMLNACFVVYQRMLILIKISFNYGKLIWV